MEGILLPVQVGYHQGSLAHQDGFISAQVTFLFLISVGITMSIGYFFTRDYSEESINGDLVNVLLIIIMMMCCLVMLVYMILGKRMVHNIGPSHITNTSRTTKDFVRDKLVIIGLLVFYIFAIFVDGFRLVAQLFCISYSNNYHRSSTDIIFHATRWIFMTMILIFAMIFDKKVFKQCVINHYCLMLLGAGVVIVWFDSVVYEYSMILKHMVPHCVNMTNVDYGTQCHKECTSEYILAEKTSHFLYTFMAEFALLAFKVLVQMFFGMKHHLEIEDAPVAEARNVTLTSSNSLQDMCSNQEEGRLQNNNQDSAISVNNVPSEYDPLLGHPESEDETDRRFDCYWKSIPCILPAIVLFNLVFVIFCVMSYWNQIVSYFIVEIIYWIPMLLCSIVGFYSAKCLMSNFSPFSGLEIMVIACTMGIFCYDLFSIYGVALTMNMPKDNATIIIDRHTKSEPPSTTMIFITLFEKILNISEAYFQASFILFARRVRHEPSHDHGRNLQYRIFWECVLYLAIANLLMWGNDSFVKVKNPAVETVMDYYYGTKTWTLIIHLTFPFALFFRFNSFLLLLYTLLTD